MRLGALSAETESDTLLNIESVVRENTELSTHAAVVSDSFAFGVNVEAKMKAVGAVLEAAKERLSEVQLSSTISALASEIPEHLRDSAYVEAFQTGIIEDLEPVQEEFLELRHAFLSAVNMSVFSPWLRYINFWDAFAFLKVPEDQSAKAGWGLDLMRNALVQSAKDVLALLPADSEGARALKLVAEDVNRLVAEIGLTPPPVSPAAISISPEWIIFSFASTLAVMMFAGLSEVDGGGSGDDEWARLAAEEGEEEPDELKVYNPEVAKAYFLQRPTTLIRRGWRSSILLGLWSTKLILDAKLGQRPEDDEEKKAATDGKRAAELRSILIRLGPTYVKLGQVLSSRQDLLPAPYVKELQTLQDSVPPFDDSIARRMIERELGTQAASRLEYLRPSPVASASLGQVYECVDKVTGKKVAVKVQRPGALCAVSLDVAIIRLIGPILYKINEKGGNLDAKALIDEWGSRFVDELDYRMEARNAREFQSAMEARDDALGEIVFAPSVESNLSARRILTAEWVEGMRIDEAKERERLCAVTLSAYLAMLLETGTLHVDPHPGNLLVAEDGRVCILDWGLVTTVNRRQQEAILTFISHLLSGDYNSLDNDLAVMGFVAPEKLEALNDAGLTRAIGVLFSAVAQGGGAQGFRKELGFNQSDQELREMGKEIRKIKGKNKKETEQLRRDAFIEMTGGQNSKVAQLSKDLEQVQAKYGNVFTIPSYFAYILRSFSVLEGIGLASNPSYSIANEAFPFVARRLLTDKSEATRKALNEILYGKEGERLSVDQAKQLAQAFGSYSEIMAQSPPEERGEKEHKGANHVPLQLKEALRICFAPEGGPLQDIVLKEAARLTGASAASAMNDTLATAFQEGSFLERQDAAVQALAKQSPLLKQVLSPFPTPLEVYQSFLQPVISDVASSGGTDTDAAEVASILSAAFTEAEGKDKEETNNDLSLFPVLPSPEAAQEALNLAMELAPGVQLAAVRFGSTLLLDAADRIGSASQGKIKNDKD